jgi:hypothetical protein
MAIPQDILDRLWARVDQGKATVADGTMLRLIVTEMQQDIFNLTASISDALVFDYEVTFEEEDSYEQGACKGLPIGALSA